jgi:hypothetical protein
MSWITRSRKPGRSGRNVILRLSESSRKRRLLPGTPSEKAGEQRWKEGWKWGCEVISPPCFACPRKRSPSEASPLEVQTLKTG